MDVDVQGASVISVAALILSVVGLWFGAVRPWWKTREAHPEVRLESLTYQTKQGWSVDERLVVVDHGPALMAGVDIRLVDEGGTDYRPAGSLWPPLPIPEIHVGQALHLTVVRAYGEKPIRSAVLSWRDGRTRKQHRTYWLTWLRVI